MKQYYNFQSDINRKSFSDTRPPLRKEQSNVSDRFQDNIRLQKEFHTFGSDNGNESDIERRNLQDELNSMKQKMKFVFEKDKEIEELKLKLTKAKNALDKTSTILDMKKKLQEEVNLLSKKNRELTEENIKLQSLKSQIKIVTDELETYRKKTKEPSTELILKESEAETKQVNETVMIHIRSVQHFLRVIRKYITIQLEKHVNTICHKYKLRDDMFVNKQIVSDLLHYD